MKYLNFLCLAQAYFCVGCLWLLLLKHQIENAIL